jgi:hypothetical protein
MNTPGLLIGGIVLLLISLICFLISRSQKRVLEEMWAVDTYTARELRRMVKGHFDATVEVEGTISCDKPLISLAAGIPSCYYKTTVFLEKKKAREVREKDSTGRHQTRTEIEYDWIPENAAEEWTVFKVHDETGFTLVDPRKGSIDTESVHSAELSQRLPWFDNRIGYSDTGKYRIEERALRPQGYVYVLGRATETGDAPIIHQPDKGYMELKKKIFLISRKSEKELGQKRGKTARILSWIAAIALLVAVILFLLYVS